MSDHGRGHRPSALGLLAWCWCAVFLCAPAPLLAASEAVLADLARQPGWWRLLHYRTDGDPSAPLSDLHSDDFFLDPGGATQPLQELRATLAAFAVPAGDAPDAQARCRFPARWRWLRQHLPDEPSLQAPLHCPAFDEWTHGDRIGSLSIVFATGYLGNPASYYGHTLLKFNFEAPAAQPRLMDASVNYGAIVDPHDGMLAYIVKGLIGGYDGSFTRIHFYFHHHNYGDVELRDLWEYRLDLDPEAVRLIVAHAWEVLGKRYTYHFFRENCGYRMAEIVQVADGVDITPRRWPWLAPQAIVQALGTAQYQGHPLLAEVTYHPSRQTRFYARHAQLSTVERDALQALVAQPDGVDRGPFSALPLASQQAVLDTQLDYYQFVGAPMALAPPALRSAYTQALAKRYALPPGRIDTPPAVPASPHRARPVGWVQAGLRQHPAGNTLTLRLRPAYYDTLDADSGQVRNALLSMVDTQLAVRREGLRLARLDLVGIESASPALSGLPGDNGAAWKLHAGAEPQRPACGQCLVARLQGDVGYGRAGPWGLFGAVYAGAALQSNRHHEGPAFTRLSANVVFRPVNGVGARVAHEIRFPVAGRDSRYRVTTAEARWALQDDLDLRLGIERDGTVRTATLGLGRYW